MENTSRTPKPVEIDLLDLLKRSVKAFTKNYRPLSLILTICLVAAVVLRFTIKKTYQSQMIVQSDILTEPFTNNIANSINDLILTRSYRALQNILSLTPEGARSIKEIRIESLEEKKALADKKDENPAFFLVTAKVHDNGIFPMLQNGLLKYVENNEYVKIRVEQRKEYYKQTIAKVDHEIRALDSLKARITMGQAFAGTGSNMVFFDPTNVYNRSIELFKEKIGLEQSLQLANSIQLIEGFNIPSRPTTPGLAVFLPAGFGVGLVLFGIYMAIKGLIWLSKEN